MALALCLFALASMAVEMAVAQEECGQYGGGSMAGAIIGTFLVTLALVAIAYLFYRYYWKNKRGIYND